MLAFSLRKTLAIPEGLCGYFMGLRSVLSRMVLAELGGAMTPEKLAALEAQAADVNNQMATEIVRLRDRVEWLEGVLHKVKEVLPRPDAGGVLLGKHLWVSHDTVVGCKGLNDPDRKAFYRTNSLGVAYLDYLQEVTDVLTILNLGVKDVTVTADDSKSKTTC